MNQATRLLLGETTDPAPLEGFLGALLKTDVTLEEMLESDDWWTSSGGTWPGTSRPRGSSP